MKSLSVTWRIRLLTFGIVILTVLYVLIGSRAPSALADSTTVSIPKGATLSQVAHDLYVRGVIRSEFLYKLYIKLIDEDTGVKTGEYLFDKPQNLFEVADRTLRGLNGFPIQKVTIFEGHDVEEVAKLLGKALPGFDQRTFFELAKADEGYLFPDTYFWPINVKPEQVVNDMLLTFNKRTKSLAADFENSPHSLTDVIKVASILEREATSTKDRKVIAGILWKRLAMNMPLQTDATFYYVIPNEADGSNKVLSLDDLKINSPYNLYKHTGLPPTPISNPSLDAIEAALHPTESKFLFYLAGRDGITHYAPTLDVHIANKVKYLN